MKKSQIIKQFKSVPLKAKKTQKLSVAAWAAIGLLTATATTAAAYKLFKPKKKALQEPEVIQKNELHYPETAPVAVEVADLEVTAIAGEAPLENDAQMALLVSIEADLAALGAFADWAREELPKIDDTLWYVALGEGKWSLHEVLAHLYFWDKYTIEEMLPLMVPNAQLQFIDIQELNNRAWTFAKTFDRERLLTLFVSNRQHMIRLFEEMPDKAFHYQLGGGEATLHSYLKIFSHHDSEHKPQFENAILKSNNQ